MYNFKLENKFKMDGEHRFKYNRIIKNPNIISIQSKYMNKKKNVKETLTQTGHQKIMKHNHILKNPF